MKPKVVVFKRNSKEDIKTINSADLSSSPAELIVCESFKELNRLLTDDLALVLVYSDLIKNYGSLDEFVLMYDTLMKFADIEKPIPFGIVFTKQTTYEEIKSMIKTSSAGVFPSIFDYGNTESYKSIEEFLQTGKSNPRHLIEKLAGNKEKPKFKNVHLTGRQRQVYELIANRGLSNKQIAQVLKISESTVKIHVSAVMRALCVRNRTQLALTK